MNSPSAVIEQLEAMLCIYTGAPHAVCVNSGSAALLLCLERFPPTLVSIPKRTYASVPQEVLNAGHRINWLAGEWRGEYQLWPLPVWDSARRFTSGMYRAGQMQCLSFAATKILGVEQGGAILLDDAKAAAELRKARYDGRTPGVDPHEDILSRGHHCPMLPSIAAQLVLQLHHLPRDNEDLGAYPYPDQSLQGCFRG
jgi:dTDP-4-amino-4,6-dideoxygalactose transaminase